MTSLRSNDDWRTPLLSNGDWLNRPVNAGDIRTAWAKRDAVGHADEACVLGGLSL